MTSHDLDRMYLEFIRHWYNLGEGIRGEEENNKAAKISIHEDTFQSEFTLFIQSKRLVNVSSPDPAVSYICPGQTSYSERSS